MAFKALSRISSTSLSEKPKDENLNDEKEKHCLTGGEFCFCFCIELPDARDNEIESQSFH